jgi:hypothetical protein
MSKQLNKLALHKAKMKLIEANSKPPEKKAKEKENRHTQEYLLKAIESASKCTLILPDEEKRVYNVIKRIESLKSEDEHWETRVNYLLSNLDNMKKQYPHYEDEAKRRKALIDEINRKGAWSAEKEKCMLDTHYWFDNYSWTADPRKTGIWALPFMLYDFQHEAVDWMEELIFTEQSSGLIEKSRDLGFSWLITSLFYKHWQHPKDGAFNALVGSMSADECDKVGDPSSLFEKLRIQARLQPLGLLPKGWNCDIPYMKAVNPENSSTITGETSNADFGRSGRYKVILFDEFSAFEQDTAAMTAASQSAPCKLYNSTVRGMGNEFHRLRHSGKVRVKTYHWTTHPYKDERWYEFQKLEMNPVQVAQELDIDYNASQPNKVYYGYNELYNIATHSEIMRALPDFRDPLTGKFRIPFGHKVMMGYDVGQSSEHANALLWFVTLRDGTYTVDGINVSGMVIQYREIIAPSHSTPRNIAAIIRGAEGIYESRLVMDRVMSHEQSTMRDALDFDYHVIFRKWTSDYAEGIDRVRDYLEVTKKHEPNPFRDASRKMFYPDAPPIMGRSQMVLAVADGQGEISWDASLLRWNVAIAKDNDGLIKTRSEYPSYHYPSSELGKEPKKQRPKKIFDDCMDVVRCCATEGFPPLNKMTEQQKFESYLPESLRSVNIDNIPVQERGMFMLQREQERKEFRQQQENVGLNHRDKLWETLIKR